MPVRHLYSASGGSTLQPTPGLPLSQRPLNSHSCRNRSTGLGDIANTRALFERALNATAPEAAAELWDAYLAFEYDVGTLQVCSSVEWVVGVNWHSEVMRCSLGW